jgi:hypothetical protein
METRQVSKILDEQSNMIQDIDLSKFMIQREGLLKEGNEWMGARLLNLKNIAEYAIHTSKDMKVVEGERLNAGYIGKKILKDVIILNNKANANNFSTNFQNIQLIQSIIRQLTLN